jgi:hypothetical protein
MADSQSAAHGIEVALPRSEWSYKIVGHPAAMAARKLPAEGFSRVV